MIEKKLLICILFVSVIVILYINHEYGFVNINNHVMIKICNETSNLQTKNYHSAKSSTNFAANTTTTTVTTIVIVSRLNEESNVINILKYNRIKHNYRYSFLRINDKKIKIFIYEIYDYISRQLIHNGIWEGEWLSQLLRYMGLFPKIQLLDFGCNMGVYTLTAAGHGYKVLAVDANINNTDRLIQSVIENNFQRNVVVVLNALSDVKREFSMTDVKDNIGGQGLINDKPDSYKVKSIFIDDLLPLVDENQKVVIKMDIEGSEVNAMRMAAGLFTKRQVVALFMEWFIIRMRFDIDVLIDFLMKRNFRPYADFFSVTELNISKHKLWPTEVVWRKIS